MKEAIREYVVGKWALKSKIMDSGMMALWLQEFIAFPKGPASVSSITLHGLQLPSILAPKDLATSSGLFGCLNSHAHTYTHNEK